jgi:membrane fusion protein, multidrug efflux system
MNYAWITGAAAVALAACSHEAALPKEVALPTQKVQVAAAYVAEQGAAEEVVGTVRARSVAALSSSIMGTVRDLPLSVGSKVKAGQLVARLSAQEIEAKAEQARALLGQAEIALRRAEELKAQNAIAPAQYDAAVAQHRVALATVAEADVMRGYTTLRAPFAGVVTAKHAEVGDLALPGRPLLVLEDPTSLRLEAAVPEAMSRDLRVGARLPVRIDGIDGELAATVSEQAPTADPQSRTVLVKLDLPEHLAGLRPGMFGRLLMRATPTHAITIPEAAVVQRGQLETVFVVDDGKAKLRLVRSGRRQDGAVELLSGLQRGELVVVSEPDRLRDGQPVVQM